ncbi:MAG TPA: glycoside hydrolase family 13 protein [Anaerolineaceae bacterium]|nr:glycoside hydrolase family 13 protein [Anaerolineaceae bacterium]
MSIPYWVEDAVFYQIFPDRFANGDPANDPPNVQPWGSIPTTWGYQGGDLRGIIQHFDYLLDLGINAIYLNPIFLATSNHRYNTTDYFRIDPKLGTLADFHALISVAHRNDVHVILDGVFNHCGRGFFAFTDLLENQERSPYRDWFHISRFPVDAYSPGPATDYLGWWRHKSLPKFNTDTPDVRKFLLSVGRYWIEQGADGWRLDVPNEIDDDLFWAEFRQVVKAANPEAYLLGEIWEILPRWCDDQHFDGLMNYPFREAVLGFIGKTIPPSQVGERLERLLKVYPCENINAMYLVLGSHDTERVSTLFEGDLRKIKMALLFQFAFPGIPGIYYGDETGMEGGKDPGCRGAFPWDSTQWKDSLQPFVRHLVHLRKRMSVLRRGSYQQLLVDDTRGIFVFSRSLGEENLVAAFNAGPTRRTVHLPVERLGWADGRIIRDLIGTEETIVSGETLTIVLPPWSGLWLT